MKGKCEIGKRVLSILMVFTLNFTSVFGMNVYAEESIQTESSDMDISDVQADISSDAPVTEASTETEVQTEETKSERNSESNVEEITETADSTTEEITETGSEALLSLQEDNSVTITSIKTVQEEEKTGNEYTVKGIITFIDGKNVYIEDETAGILLFLKQATKDIGIGDVVVAKGTYKVYNNIIELDKAEVVEKAEDKEELPSTVTTLKEIKENFSRLQSKRVLIKGVTLGEINTTGATEIKDSEESSIIYKIPQGEYKKDDVVDVYAVVSRYKDTIQLRVAKSEDIQLSSNSKVDDPKDPITEDMIPSGCLTIDQVCQDDVKKDDEVTVIGQIVTRYGKNNTVNTTILEDIVDGKVVALQVYDKLQNFNEGDVVTLKGKIGEYGKVKQLTNVTEKTQIATDKDVIEPEEVNISQLQNDDYLCHYVVIKNVTLGAYNEKNVEVKDSENTINIYQPASYPENVKEGAIVDLYAVASKYNTTYQLRVGYSSAYKLVGSKDIVVDEDYIFELASIRGTFSEELKENFVYADLYSEGDQLDHNTKVSVSNGKKPEISNKNGDVITRALGTKGLFKDEYYLIETNSEGYGALNLSFSMRTSKTAAKDFQVLYSLDGEEYKPAGKGKIEASYTKFTSDSSENIHEEKDITDGKFSLLIDGKFQDITLAIPDEAADAEKLYIQVKVISDKALQVKDGQNTTIGDKGVNYFEDISLKGSPLVDDSRCGFVKADPEAGEIPANSEITLSTTTKNAKIKYAINGGDFQEYDEDHKPVIKAEDFPANIVCYATKENLKDSIKTSHKYVNGKVETVKASPNGGAVKVNTVVMLSCETEDAEISYSTDQGATWIPYDKGIKLEELPITILAKATKEGYLDSEPATFSFTKRTNDKYNIYFGQIHSHTSYSDGAGTAEDAFQYARNQAENIDFLAVTDHSNSFDNDTQCNIKDGSSSEEWKQGHELADKYTREETPIDIATATDDSGDADDTVQDDSQDNDYFVGIMGYEMTWSGGAPGHMNTFNTDGFMSRNMDGYKNGAKSSLTNYYGQLKTVPNAMSMFNHPGTTFGDFYDFGYYDEEIDNYITLIEVGNGEGAIGSSGYFPSYEYYTRALDKGWHVAPTNNQDNHKGKWGDANTGRTVILADTLTRENIYDALRNMRVYATEDNDLDIQYTLNGMDMGYIYEEAPDSCHIKVELKDPTDQKIGKVEVIVNAGLSVANQTIDDSEGTLEFDLPADYSYYYIRVTQPDGDKAVTAPVWVSSVEAVGISSLSTDASLEVAGEEINLNLGLYNNEKSDFLVDSIIYTLGDGSVIHTTDVKEKGLEKVESLKEATDTFGFTYDKAGKITITATVIGTLNGIEKKYTKDLELTYIAPDMVTKVIVDGTHNNDYVTGYYGGNVGNFADIAAADYVQVNVVTDKITEDMLEDCALLVLSAPAKKKGTYQNKAYEPTHFEDDFVSLVKNYVADGGNVIFCGLADYQDTSDCQSTTEINKVLESIGANVKLNSDEIVDDEKNGGQAYRLYFDQFNMDSPYLLGVTKEQTYSAYSGCSIIIDPQATNAEALVYGHSTTYSIDSKKLDQNYQEVPKGDIVALAHETLPSGSNIFVGGTVFVSDFEVKSDLDNAGDSYYANRNILLNILSNVKKDTKVSTIAEMRNGNMGDIFTIEGYVTAGNVSEENAFFDTIYVQDATGGTTVFPFSKDNGIVPIGTKLRLVGFVDAYQGDKELQIISSNIIQGDTKVFEPEKISAKNAMDYNTNGGKLLKVEGCVTKVVKNTAGVDYFYIKDESGAEVRIFIDGYIKASDGEDTINEDVKEGNMIEAVGLCYMNPDGVCLRVRDRAEVCLKTGKDDSVVKPSSGAVASFDATISLSKSKKSHKKNVITATVRTTTEPTMKTSEGKIVSGWSEVVTEVIKQASLADENVPLADGSTGMKAKKVVASIILDEKNNMIIPKDVVEKMALSGDDFEIHIGKKMILTLTHEMLLMLEQDFDLNYTEKRFTEATQGFEVYWMHPQVIRSFAGTMSMVINLGKENALKEAYVFARNIDNMGVHYVGNITMDEQGNLPIRNIDYSDCIILFK